jgi:hypothetical protein
MTFDRANSGIRTPERSPIDSELAEKISQIDSYGGEMYDNLLLTDDELALRRHEFEDSGQRQNPDLRPTNTDFERLGQRESALQGLRTELLGQDLNEVNQLYLWKLLTGKTQKETDGQDGAYRKDMVYLEGNIRARQAASREPSIISLGDQGKFDITNGRHLGYPARLGVIAKEQL